MGCGAWVQGVYENGCVACVQRMTQFKQKSKDVTARAGAKSRQAAGEKGPGADKPAETAVDKEIVGARLAGTKDNVGLGLLSYPVLQAADILLYKATHVPVGEDQHQHLELTRDIAGTFNHNFTSLNSAADGASPADVFPLPETLSFGDGSSRIMSLRDASKKMSKSDPDDFSRIDLTDSAERIREKIAKAKTDSTTGFTFDPLVRPEKSNLLSIFSAVTGTSVTQLAEQYATVSAAKFKADLAEAVISHIVPIGSEAKRLIDDRVHVEKVMEDGAARAREIAAQTMKEVRAAVGIA